MTNTQPFSRRLVSFCDQLRKQGVDVSVDDIETASRTLMAVNPLDRAQFYTGLKVALIDDPFEEETFDEVFAEFWDSEPETRDGSPAPRDESEDIDVDSDLASGPDEETAEFEETDRDSPESGDRNRDPPGDEDSLDVSESFKQSGSSQASEPEANERSIEVGVHERATELSMAFQADRMMAEELSMLVRELGALLGTRRGFESRRHPSGQMDLRGALQSVRILDWDDLPREEPAQTNTSVRFLVDVSHSMLQNLDQEFLFHFLFECSQRYDDPRTFFFDTSTTEATDHFRTADVSKVIEQMHATKLEWGAGTTIGACLREITTDNPFVVDHNTVVVIISDGWDAGDLELLREAMQELERRSNAILWLNPLASAERYEPEISGMQTALPFVDHFDSFGSMDDLRSLVSNLQTSALVRA